MDKNHKSVDIHNIIEGCKKKDREAQRKLYEMFSPKLYAIAIRYTGNTEDAKDLLHDGFIKIFGKINKYTYNGSFDGWIQQVFVNFVLDFLKKKRLLYYNDELKNEKYNEIFDENFYTIEEKEISKLKEEVLLKIIEKLSPKYRIVFNLYVLEGYSHKEIAKFLNISESTSKSNFFRAKQKLRKMIEEYLKNRKL